MQFTTLGATTGIAFLHLQLNAFSGNDGADQPKARAT